MEEALDPFDFDLSLALGATIPEMEQRITNHEYLARRALAVYRNARAELEAKARRGAG